MANFTTWANYTPTVTLVGGAGNTVPVYTTNTGRWMRIGNIAFVRIYLTGDGGAEGAGTGQFTVALPVAVSASAPAAVNQFAGTYLNNVTLGQLYATVLQSGTTTAINYWSSLTALTALTGDDQNNTSRTIVIGLQYEV